MWSEFRRIKFGMVGLALLGMFVVVVLIEPLIVPFPDAATRWRDMTYWVDNPRNAKPAWVNWFTSKDYAPSARIQSDNIVSGEFGAGKLYQAELPYKYSWDKAPSDVTLRMNVTGNARYEAEFIRPDGLSVTYQKTSQGAGTRDLRISVAQNLQPQLYQFAGKYEDPRVMQSTSASTINPLAVLFSQAEKGALLSGSKPLDGTYTVRVKVVAADATSSLNEAELIVAGGVQGVLGTDNMKRDLWSGLIAGTKWALIIGLLTSFIAVVVGVIYGVTSGYYGGFVDSLMNRIYEIFSSVPLLPILIVMSAVFKPSIWIMIAMMCIFFWVGPVRTVRSIALQIKEASYIEAARGLGASNRRILMRHMIPQLVPYAFASMALSVPGAIVYEASISLIGLGDATRVTWGQILQAAFSSGAVLQGIWWWVVPPGVAIALMGMTFAFIGFAMDTILNPKLKTR